MDLFKKLIVSLLSVAVFSLLGAGSALCQDIALSFDSLGSGFNFNQGTFSLGWRFTANQDVSVSALGFYDANQDGLTTSHAVGIFDVETCTLLASTTVMPSDPLEGFFRFHDIAPIVLPGGADYYIASVTGGEQYAVNVTTLNVNPAITFWGFAIFGNTQSTSQLLCPNGPAGMQGFKGDFGPSFKIVTGGVNPTSCSQPGDADKDGVENCNDPCPLDRNKTEPLLCGCEVAESPDCLGTCKGEAADLGCGCGVVDCSGTQRFLTNLTKLVMAPSVEVIDTGKPLQNAQISFNRFDAAQLIRRQLRSSRADAAAQLQPATEAPRRLNVRYEVLVQKVLENRKRVVLRRTVRANSVLVRRLASGLYTAKYRAMITTKDPRSSEQRVVSRTNFSPAQTFSF
jgi:hypothetical protein